MNRFLMAAAAGVFLLGGLGAVELDRGGVTFDFEKISKERFKPDEKAVNLLSNPDGSKAESAKDPCRWMQYCYLHTKEISDKDPRRAKARKTVQCKFEKGVGIITKPASLRDFLPAKVVTSTSGGLRKIFPLDGKGGTYQVSFYYQAKHDGSGGCCTIIHGTNKPVQRHWNGKTAGFHILSFADSPGKWQFFQQEFRMPPEALSAQFVMRIDGVGELKFKDAKVIRIEDKERFTVKCSPHSFLDSTFALSSGQPAIATFLWKRNCSKKEAVVTNPELVLNLPEGVVFKDSAGLRWKQNGNEVRIDLRPWRDRPAAQEGFDYYLRIPALLYTEKAAGTKPGELTFYIAEKGKPVSATEKLSLLVIPAFKGAKCAYYYPGIYTGGRYMDFNKPEFHELNSRNFTDAGVRWIVNGGKGIPFWRKAGVDVITPELFYVSNGYRVGLPKGRPAADKYKYIGTQGRENFENCTCPAAVYEKRPYFVNSTIPYIKKALAGCDGLWANWEPYAFAGRGCFCDVCREKFAKFVNVPLEQMKKEWPSELAFGKKYYEKAVRFRSLEHAKLVKTIDEVVIEATGGKKSFGFIPGVQVDTMSSDWKLNGFDKETHPSDYAASLRWIDPWGPYACWMTQKPYVYTKSFNLRTFLKARDVRSAVNRDYPLPNRPKLLAFPHGYQLLAWVTQPESIEMEMLSFLFNGYEAATFYAFPRGYDNRYWNAFARGTRTAAKYDKFVAKGRNILDRVKLEPVAPYALPTTIVEGMSNKVIRTSTLQAASYELDGKIIVAAFNFWMKGEAFFNLKVAGLEPETSYRITSGNKDFTTFTGAQLAKGVMLHAGAMRCVVYEIAPAAQSPALAEKVTQRDLQTFRKAGLPALEKAVAEDKVYEENYGYKESKMEDISNAGIKCKVTAPGVFTLKSGKNSATFLVPSSNISQWEVDGRKVVNGNKMSGFGSVAFWYPSLQIGQGFLVTKETKIPGGVQICLERKLLDRDNPQVERLMIRQTFSFTDNLKKIAVETNLDNGSDRTMTCGMRYNFMPCITAEKGGYTLLNSNGKPKKLNRDFNHAYYYCTDKEAEAGIRKLFEIRTQMPSIPISSPDVEFHAPGRRVTLTLTPKAEFAGVGIWDSGRQAAATYEPCFKVIQMTPFATGHKYTAVMEVK